MTTGGTGVAPGDGSPNLSTFPRDCPCSTPTPRGLTTPPPLVRPGICPVRQVASQAPSPVTGREVPAHSDLFVPGRVTLALSRAVADRAPRLPDPDRSRWDLAASARGAGTTCRIV